MFVLNIPQIHKYFATNLIINLLQYYVKTVKMKYLWKNKHGFELHIFITNILFL